MLPPIKGASPVKEDAQKYETANQDDSAKALVGDNENPHDQLIPPPQKQNTVKGSEEFHNSKMQNMEIETNNTNSRNEVEVKMNCC